MTHQSPKSAPKLAAVAMLGGIAFASMAQAADDVVIVYDASGSMWGQIDGISKIEIARDVMGELVNGWDAGTNLGLVAYGHRRQGDCGDIETLIAPGPVDKAAFIDKVRRIKPVGKTPISASVQHAADLLSYRDNPATVVLISDGVETCNADPCALSAQLAQQGVKFTAHVVGFDLEDAAHASLSCIAQNTGGMFVPARNADELQGALQQVQAAMETQAPAPTPTPEPKAPPLPEVGLTGPETATTGAAFEVRWSDVISPRDMVSILPMGTDEGTRGPYLRVGDKNAGRLTAPAEAGLYELRYILNEGTRTLARAPIEVVEAEVGLTGPETATTGAAFEVRWSDVISPRDMVSILPMGTDEGTRGPYLRVGDKNAGRLTAPAEAGLYELRYILNEGTRTLARAPIEVVEAEVGLTGPETVRAATDVDVSWSSTVHPRDMVSIVPLGADEGARGTYLRAGTKTQGRLKAPSEPGLYEIRYILNEGARTLAHVPLEVVGADAPLDDGAGLSVPESAAPGATITVSWTGESASADQRIALARKDQPDFSWIAAQKIGAQKAMDLTMPEEPGYYEVRFLDISGRTLLGRSVVEVK